MGINIHLKKEDKITKTYNEEDFMPQKTYQKSNEPVQKVQTPEEQATMLKVICAAFGGRKES